MTAMEVPARSEGRNAMEALLTKAEKVRRQLKAGRKPKTSTPPRSAFDAVLRLFTEEARARDLMERNGLKPDDIRAMLVYSASGTVTHGRLPAPENIGPTITLLEQASARFLGILWEQTDRDPRAKMPMVMWGTEFDKRDAAELLAYRNALTKKVRN
ncbi:MAG: hypothetical protein ACLPH3_05900 [Terracidiphilus sp.]